jgi:hypothetical protein
MNDQPLMDELLRLIRKMEKHAARLQASGQPVPRLDMDILLRDTRRLYDILLDWSPADGNLFVPETPSAAEPDPGTATDRPATAAGAGETTAATGPRPGEPVGDLFSDLDDMGAAPPALSPPADEEPAESVHDKIARTREGKSLADTLSSKPGDDLRKMIGINEKFKFVHDLFDGNLQEYVACINRLNDAGTLAEAEAFVEEAVLQKYEADPASETYRSLLGLIQKRFHQ